ncbi:MAG: RNA pseudouridine synthase [Lachnospiraceae bacterium]
MITQVEILYEDEVLVVCRKPAGIPVQTARQGQPDMISILRNRYARKKQYTEIFPIHRLDQPVEGVMVFARTKEAASSLSRQVQEKEMDKYYLAIVAGIPSSESGCLEDYLCKDGRTNMSKVVPKGTPHAKFAKLSYQVVKKYENKSLVQIKLETGRHHQIRVQLAHAGYPLVGDKKYNSSQQEVYLPIGLCSVRITFCHPITGKKMDFKVSPIGEAFEKNR